MHYRETRRFLCGSNRCFPLWKMCSGQHRTHDTVHQDPMASHTAHGEPLGTLAPRFCTTCSEHSRWERAFHDRSTPRSAPLPRSLEQEGRPYRSGQARQVGDTHTLCIEQYRCNNIGCYLDEGGAPRPRRLDRRGAARLHVRSRRSGQHRRHGCSGALTGMAGDGALV